MKIRNRGESPIRSAGRISRVEEAERARSRHRIGLVAATGAVIVGGLLLGFAVSGNDWGGELNAGAHTLFALAGEQSSGTSTSTPADNDTTKSASGKTVAKSTVGSVDPRNAKTAETKPASVPETGSSTGQGAKTAAVKPASAAAPKTERSAASGAPGVLSPDDRIARAMKSAAAARPPQKKVAALISAARDVPESRAAGGLTTAIPESSAYAPALGGSEPAEDDAGALKAIQNVDRSDSVSTDAVEPDVEAEKPQEKAAAPFPAGPLRDASATDAVHMRSAPSNQASILTVVPANASVQATRDCPQSWCGVVYNGKHGFVYEGYIRSTKTAQATTTTPAPKSAEEKAEASRSAAEKSFDQTMRKLLNGG